MADADLITGYLAALRQSLRWRTDVDDLVCELDDHLRCAAAGLEVRGLDPFTAQRHVLDRFGDQRLVASSFSLTHSGGAAMPTRLTRTAGMFAFVASVAWLGVAPTTLIGAGSDDWEVRYATLALVTFVASLCTTIALFGMLRRAGTGDGAGIALGLAIVATVALGVFTWAWLVAVSLMTVAALITVLRLRASGLGSGVAGILLVVAWPLGIAVAVVLDLMKVGQLDSYGEAYLGQHIGLAVGAMLFAAGLFLSGRWLRSEAVVDVPDSMATA